MKVQLVNGKSPIGDTIRVVAQAQASRLFKSETNTQERSALVFMVIRSEIAISLYDLGVSMKEIVDDIDPTDDVLVAMLEVGFVFTTQQLVQGVRNE